MASENLECYPKNSNNQIFKNIFEACDMGECTVYSLIFLKAKNEEILLKNCFTLVYCTVDQKPFCLFMDNNKKIL